MTTRRTAGPTAISFLYDLEAEHHRALGAVVGDVGGDRLALGIASSWSPVQGRL